MHSAISSFPNRKIYGGKLRNGPDMNVTIDEQMPGLRNILVDIISDEITNPAKQDRFRKIVSDADLRRHYVEVKGTRVPHESTKSMIVHEHIDVFFNKIFPKLREYFRSNDKSMNKHVMIICGYNFAVRTGRSDDLGDMLTMRSATSIKIDSRTTWLATHP